MPNKSLLETRVDKFKFKSGLPSQNKHFMKNGRTIIKQVCLKFFILNWQKLSFGLGP